ncbi:MAG: hypothetical protein IKT00_08090 [Prevotella sp.]|nr:hypothetical protein [Prevotella sp.]
MKKEYLSWCWATLVAAIFFAGLVSCGDDDKEEVTKDSFSRIEGTLRQCDFTNDIINVPIMIYVPGDAGLGSTGHYETEDNYFYLPMSVLVFNKDHTVLKYYVGRKESAEILKKQGNYPGSWTDFDGYPNWCYYNNGETDNPEKLTYQVDTDKFTVTLSNGETYYLHFYSDTYKLQGLSDGTKAKYIEWKPSDNFISSIAI